MAYAMRRKLTKNAEKAGGANVLGTRILFSHRHTSAPIASSRNDLAGCYRTQYFHAIDGTGHRSWRPAMHTSLKENTMKLQKGFTLIEMMIVVAILGVVAAIALPSYTSYVVRGNRAAAQAFMIDVASRQKQYQLDARSYALDLTTLGMTVPTEVKRHYANCCAIVVVAVPPSFTITAIPTSTQQLGDGTLTLSSDGTKTPASKW